MRNWSKHVEDIREFGEVRPSYMREHLKAQFDLGEMYWLEVLNETPDLGGFQSTEIPQTGIQATQDSISLIVPENRMDAQGWALQHRA